MDVGIGICSTPISGCETILALIKKMEDLMIFGWIEKCEDGRFFGWFSSSNELLNEEKLLHVYSSGELKSVKKIALSRVERQDLDTYQNTFSFEFELDEREFYQGASTCSIHFKMHCSGNSYWMFVTPQLVSQSIAALDEEKKGLAFGRVSADGAAVVGAGGSIFLKQGTNNVEGLYTGATTIDISAWLRVFYNRKLHSAEQNYQYIQILIPEKASVMYWKAPFYATKGSPPLNEIISSVSRASMSEHLICGEDFLPDEVHSESVFRPFDTHMSTYGSKLLIDELLRRLNIAETIAYQLGAIVHGNTHGDIGVRFLEDGDVRERPPLYENLLNANGDQLDPVLIGQFDPPSGNVGLYRHWKCANAPVKKRVLCFGGSSFERGEVSSTLSWWCARLFSEFHFYWSPDSLHDAIKDVSPDVVICQTIERFLTLVPRS